MLQSGFLKPEESSILNQQSMHSDNGLKKKKKNLFSFTLVAQIFKLVSIIFLISCFFCWETSFWKWQRLQKVEIAVGSLRNEKIRWFQVIFIGRGVFCLLCKDIESGQSIALLYTNHHSEFRRHTTLYSKVSVRVKLHTGFTDNLRISTVLKLKSFLFEFKQTFTAFT